MMNRDSSVLYILAWFLTNWPRALHSQLLHAQSARPLPLGSSVSSNATKERLRYGFWLRTQCITLTLVIYCKMIQCAVIQNLKIQLILLLILLIFCLVSIAHCFAWAFWYSLSIAVSLIILYSVSAHSGLHAAQPQSKSKSRGREQARSLWKNHRSGDPAETNSTHGGHFLRSFDIPAKLPWEERADCLFCRGLLHFARGERDY